MDLLHKDGNVRPAVMGVLIAFGVTGAYLFMSTRSTLWDRDEPELARVTAEMVESGDYLVPTLNGRMWAAKPPLLFWLMSVPVRVLGQTELACRFFSAIGIAATCMLTFFIGKRLVGPKAGIWAMLILASTFLVMVVGTSVLTDGVMLPFIVAAMAVFLVLPETGSMRFSYAVLMGLVLGFGILAKGPIGLMPIPAMAVALWFNRKNRDNTKQCVGLIGVSLVIGFLIFTAWAMPVQKATAGEFLRVFIGRDIIHRAFKPMQHHGGDLITHLPYYLPVLIIGFFPWTLHLPGALSAVAGARVGGKYGRIFLLSWILPAFILMTLAATKLPHYILFIWPALALAVAGTITAAQQNKLAERDKKWLRRGVWLFGPLAAIVSIGLMVGPWFLQIPGLRWSGLAAGMVLFAMSVIAVYPHLLGRVQVSAVILLVGLIVLQIPVQLGVMPAIEHVKIPPYIADTINTVAARDTPVATYKFHEPSLNFYLDRYIERLNSKELLVDWVGRSGPGILIIPAEEFDELQQECGVLPLQKIASKEGLNYSKGKVLEVVALARKGQ
ncbi:MAG: ArnT family glycosyltransferase [Planctomycetota bacterium]